MRKFLLAWSMLLASYCLYAQQQTVSGTVTDGVGGTGLPGVSILVKGTTNGTTTDNNGAFSIQASPEDALTFSFIGFASQEVVVGSQTSINITLDASLETLSEVVVIGYGERKKGDVTGAVGSIGSKEIAKTITMSPELTMQGKMAGVYVSTPSGTPFDRPTVRIRGVSTFNGNLEPLYVIDGVPITEGGSEGIGHASRGDLRSPINILTSINPNDIESISVLKDASAAAIYGVRAANGVVLITTKKGSKGKPKIDISMRQGVQSIAAKPADVLNTQQYTALIQEQFANNPTIGTPMELQFDPNSPLYLGNSPTHDWQNPLLNKNSAVSDYSVGVGGGSESATYYFGAGYGKTEGVMKGKNLERYSISMNLNVKASKVVEAGLTFRGSHNKALDNAGPSFEGNYLAPPWQPIYDPNGLNGYAAVSEAEFIPNPAYNNNLAKPGDFLKFNEARDVSNGDYGWEKGFHKLYGRSTRNNPLASLSMDDNRFKLFRGLGSAYVQIQPLKGLRIKGTISGDFMINTRSNFNNYGDASFSAQASNPFRIPNAVGSYGLRETKNYNWVKELTVNYNRSFGDHNFDLLLNGMEQTYRWEFGQFANDQIFFTEPYRWSVPEAPDNPSYKSALWGYSPTSLIGYMSRLSYKFKDKYYLDATVRRDASSRFNPNDRVGIFPSFAAAWRVSSEQFMQSASITFLNDLKIRGGYGELGNQETTLGWQYLTTITGSPKYSWGVDPNGVGSKQLGVRPSGYANKLISWETAATTTIGLDALLFNNTISFTAEYYRRDTRDIIQSASLPPTSGFATTPVDLNVGTARNSGIELSLGYNKQVGDLTFGISGNFTTTKNRVTQLNLGEPVTVNGNRVEIGQPMFFLYGYKVGGIFQTDAEVAAWKALYSDATGNNTKAPGDYYFQNLRGNPAPGEFYNYEPDTTVNVNDQVYLGKTIPGFYYGINLNLGYKGFDISALFQGQGDVQKVNGVRWGGESMNSPGNNQLTSVANRFTIENPSTTMPRAVAGDPSGNARFSDRWVEDAGFMRLRNIQFGYTVPSSLLNKTGFIQNFRIYVSGSNLLTITKWTGIDPENDWVPPARVISLGINASF